MKRLSALVLGAVFVISSVRADEWLKNGDFSNGDAHWMGNGRLAEDSTAPADPFAAPNSTSAPVGNGLVVELRHSDWTKITQDFEAGGTQGELTVKYQFSPDTVFSEKAEDYINVPDHIGFDGWLPFNCIPGNWMVLVSDFTKRTIWYYKVDPTVEGGLNAPHTYTSTVQIDPHGNKTICLTFPPGQGKVTVTLISIKN